MPKVEIDYSNTIIYKITCNDPSMTDVYVGHTTNFVQRKHAHKQSCNNDKSSNHNCKLYKVIRNNGGWQNWIMEIVNFFNCHDHYEARKKEQEYFVLLNATLNSIEPMPKPKEKKDVIKCKPEPNPTCDVCNKIFANDKLYEEHLQTNILKKSCQIEPKDEKSQKILKMFECEKCDYICGSKKDFAKHLGTRKHQLTNNTKDNENKQRVCECGKKYSCKQSLYVHKKNCKQPQPLLKYDQIFAFEKSEQNFVPFFQKGDTSTLEMNLITQLLKQNDEFKSLMVEQNNKMMELFQEVCKNNIAKEVTIDKTTT
jgi:uncharacterized C2H2 Zn-finger protein